MEKVPSSNFDVLKVIDRLERELAATKTELYDIKYNQPDREPTAATANTAHEKSFLRVSLERDAALADLASARESLEAAEMREAALHAEVGRLSENRRPDIVGIIQNAREAHWRQLAGKLAECVEMFLGYTTPKDCPTPYRYGTEALAEYRILKAE